MKVATIEKFHSRGGNKILGTQGSGGGGGVFFPSSREDWPWPWMTICLLHMCILNHDHIMYGSWDLKYKGQSFLSFWAIFCPLTLQTSPKIKILKSKKTPGDIIILHLCTTNNNCMMYCSWDIKRNRQNFVILGYFLSFYPHNNPKNQNFEKMKKTPGYVILHMSTINEVT